VDGVHISLGCKKSESNGHYGSPCAVGGGRCGYAVDIPPRTGSSSRLICYLILILSEWQSGEAWGTIRPSKFRKSRKIEWWKYFHIALLVLKFLIVRYKDKANSRPSGVRCGNGGCWGHFLSQYSSKCKIWPYYMELAGVCLKSLFVGVKAVKFCFEYGSELPSKIRYWR
jgi:hypothetical protein